MAEARPSPEIEGFIKEAADKYSLDARLLRAVMQAESNFNPNVRDGSKGEIGPMQLMPETRRNLGINDEQARDPRINTFAGAYWLRSKIAEQGGDTTRGVVAYNGEGPAAERYGKNVMALYNQSSAGPESGDFDWSSVKPVQSGGDFDWSTARPAQPAGLMERGRQQLQQARQQAQQDWQRFQPYGGRGIEQAVGMVGGMLKDIYGASAPNIANQMMQRFTGHHLFGTPWRASSLAQIPGKAAQTMAPLLIGAPETLEEEQAAQAERRTKDIASAQLRAPRVNTQTPLPEAPATEAPSTLERYYRGAKAFGKTYLKHKVPGYQPYEAWQAAKEAMAEGTTPPTPRPPAAPPVARAAVMPKAWKTPQELWGTRIPPPELTTPSRTMPGQVGPERVGIRPAAPLDPRTGLALPGPATAPLSRQLGMPVQEGEYLPPQSRGALPPGQYAQPPIQQQALPPGQYAPPPPVTRPALPARGTPIRLPESFPPAREPIIRTTPSEPLPPLTTREAVTPATQAEKARAALDKIAQEPAAKPATQAKPPRTPRTAIPGARPVGAAPATAPARGIFPESPIGEGARATRQIKILHPQEAVPATNRPIVHDDVADFGATGARFDPQSNKAIFLDHSPAKGFKKIWTPREWADRVFKGFDIDRVQPFRQQSGQAGTDSLRIQFKTAKQARQVMDALRER